MNIIEAIEGFKMDNYLFGNTEIGTQERNNLAIQALQEKQKREKGCEYCRGEEIIKVAIDNTYSIDVEFEDLKNVKYCPMCGRKLEG